MGKHLEQAPLPVYDLQCLTGKQKNKKNNTDNCCITNKWVITTTTLIPLGVK